MVIMIGGENASHCDGYASVDVVEILVCAYYGIVLIQICECIVSCRLTTHILKCKD